MHGLVLRRGQPLMTVVLSGAKGGSASEEARQELPRVGLQLPRHAYRTGHLDSKGSSVSVTEGRVEPYLPCSLCLVPDRIDVRRIPCVGVGG